jgi:hypothetical protein
MRTWVTSDLHFGHKNIMKFCPVTRARFRDDVDYMNTAMVEEWNAKVKPEVGVENPSWGNLHVHGVQSLTGSVARHGGLTFHD